MMCLSADAGNLEYEVIIMKRQAILAGVALILFVAAATGLVATLPLAAEADFSRLRDVAQAAPLADGAGGAFVQTALASAQESAASPPAFPAEEEAAARHGARFPTDEDTVNRLSLHYAGIIRDLVLSDIGVEIPDSAAHAGDFHDTYDGLEFFVSLVWTDAQNHSLQAHGSFRDFDEDWENGALLYYSVSNLDETTIGPIITTARDAFSSQLGIVVPDDAILEDLTVMRFVQESSNRLNVFITWYDPGVYMARDPLSSTLAPIYNARYSYADPLQGTGNLTLLEKSFAGGKAFGSDETPAYSQAQEDAAIKAARAFAERLAFSVEEIQMVHPIATNADAGLTVIFSTPDGLSLLISVTHEGDVIGYQLRSNIVEEAQGNRLLGA